MVFIERTFQVGDEDKSVLIDETKIIAVCAGYCEAMATCKSQSVVHWLRQSLTNCMVGRLECLVNDFIGKFLL